MSSNLVSRSWGYGLGTDEEGVIFYKKDINDSLHKQTNTTNQPALTSAVLDVIYGRVQVGKTAEIIRRIEHAFKNGHNVLLITRNSVEDLDQFSNRIALLRKNGNTKLLVTKSNDIRKDDLVELFFSSNPMPILATLGNPKRLNKILNELKKCDIPAERANVECFIDECDKIPYDLDEKSTYLNKVDECARELMPYFKAVHHITATPLVTLSTYGSFMPTKVTKLPVPSNYYGIQHGIRHVRTEAYVKQDNKGNGTRSSYDAASDAKNLDLLMKDILASNRAICLISATNLTSEHLKAVQYFYEEYPSVTLIEYNGNKQQNETQESCKIYRSKDNNNGKPFSGRPDVVCDTIREGLTQLQKEYYVSGHNRHVVIIAGQMAGRNISFVSDDFGWHLTHQYLVPAKSANLDTMVQAVRLSGIYENNPVLKFFCTQEIWDQLNKHLVFLDEITEDAANGTSSDMIKRICDHQTELDGRKMIDKRKSDGSLLNGFKLAADKSISIYRNNCSAEAELIFLKLQTYLHKVIPYFSDEERDFEGSYCDIWSVLNKESLDALENHCNSISHKNKSEVRILRPGEVDADQNKLQVDQFGFSFVALRKAKRGGESKIDGQTHISNNPKLHRPQIHFDSNNRIIGLRLRQFQT